MIQASLLVTAALLALSAVTQAAESVNAFCGLPKEPDLKQNLCVMNVDHDEKKTKTCKCFKDLYGQDLPKDSEVDKYVKIICEDNKGDEKKFEPWWNCQNEHYQTKSGEEAMKVITYSSHNHSSSDLLIRISFFYSPQKCM